ncbi:MAG: FAD-dependent oxidoreductase [Oscillospiraceae bacterium]|nr:FAD-dependent oxidoreductase [Oscillospiraceae bacterium]
MASVWHETIARHPRPALDGDRAADVLIIGGGLSGILTAHLLQEAGVHAIVVEGKTIGGGVSGNTTAKITAQHGLIYADLIRRRGAEIARQYYDANTAAIARYRALHARFPCDFEEKTAHVYSVRDRLALEREAEAYRRLGISGAIADHPPLPFSTAGAIAMEGQAQFHPLKLLYALAEGLEVYENTFVHQIDEHAAYTSGGTIRARRVVLATHYPLVNIPGLYFVKLYQHRSYVLALENAPLVDGMYLDERETGLSFRTFGDLLFVGGGDHKTGKAGGSYAALEAFVRKVYPKAAIKHRWATQDCMSLDRVPYIGRHRSGAKTLYVATGFNKWGMTGSMVAAGLLTDLIVQGKSAWEVVYRPQRSMLSGQLFVNLGAAAKGLLSLGGPRCAHMGCKLHKNRVEGSWDCACHGSRFDQEGHVLNNPAKKRLSR